MKKLRLLAMFLIPLSLMACSREEGVTVRLGSTADIGQILGVAVLRADGKGTTVSLNVSDLEPGATVRAVINAGTCKDSGASPLALPDLEADEEGHAEAGGRLLFRGQEDVALDTLADGEHVVRLVGDEGDLACGIVPKA